MTLSSFCPTRLLEKPGGIYPTWLSLRVFSIRFDAISLNEPDISVSFPGYRKSGFGGGGVVITGLVVFARISLAILVASD